LTTGISAEEPSTHAARTALRRHVFFVHGFDPRGVKGYYERLTQSCRALAEQEGRRLEVGAPETRGPHATLWRVRAEASAGEVDTTFEFLHWDDIVRKHWSGKGSVTAQIAAVRALWIFYRSGVLARLRNGGRGMYLAVLTQGLAPILLAIATLLMTLFAGELGAWLARALDAPAPWGWLVALPALAAALHGWDRAWRGLSLEWLARGFACIIETARGEKTSWNDRCREFAGRMLAVDREDGSDEIVLLGHSLGAALAVGTLRRFLEQRGQGEASAKRKIAFATLGQVIPLYNLIDRSGDSIRDVRAVAASPEVDWVNVTSGSDPASACRLSPLVGAEEGEAVPVVPRWDPEFHRILTPERFLHIRRRPLEYHFQYLKSADCPDGFDLIRMMISPAPFFSEAPR
jgi:hypothetical protein